MPSLLVDVVEQSTSYVQQQLALQEGEEEFGLFLKLPLLPLSVDVEV